MIFFSKHTTLRVGVVEFLYSSDVNLEKQDHAKPLGVVFL